VLLHELSPCLYIPDVGSLSIPCLSSHYWWHCDWPTFLQWRLTKSLVLFSVLYSDCYSLTCLPVSDVFFTFILSVFDLFCSSSFHSILFACLHRYGDHSILREYWFLLYALWCILSISSMEQVEVERRQTGDVVPLFCCSVVDDDKFFCSGIHCIPVVVVLVVLRWWWCCCAFSVLCIPIRCILFIWVIILLQLLFSFTIILCSIHSRSFSFSWHCYDTHSILSCLLLIYDDVCCFWWVPACCNCCWLYRCVHWYITVWCCWLPLPAFVVLTVVLNIWYLRPIHLYHLFDDTVVVDTY